MAVAIEGAGLRVPSISQFLDFLGKSFPIGCLKPCHSHLTVYPHRCGWRFAWYCKESRAWKYVTRVKKADIRAAAENKLDHIFSGSFSWSLLPPGRLRFLEAVHRETRSEDEKAVLAFLAGRQKSAEVSESVRKFMTWKIEKAGELTPNLQNLKRHVELMAEKFSGKTVIDITSDELTGWWRKQWGHLKPKTRNDARASLVAFWNWCIMETLYPKEVTPAERIPQAVLDKHERRVITLDEFMALAAAIQPQHRSTIVLLAFCGFRPEEVCPPTKKGAKKKSKRGIRREEIDWEDDCIRVPDVVAKTGVPRVIPLLPTARVWLEWAGIRPGQTGAVCEENLAEIGETKRLGEVVFKTGWPQDALRHSYGSYRNAVVRSLSQVAEEMGSSEAMLRKHYHNPRSRSEGEAWFDLRPPEGSPCVIEPTQVSAEEFLEAISDKT